VTAQLRQQPPVFRVCFGMIRANLDSVPKRNNGLFKAAVIAVSAGRFQTSSR
jgi:hypothetical protein